MTVVRRNSALGHRGLTVRWHELRPRLSRGFGHETGSGQGRGAYRFQRGPTRRADLILSLFTLLCPISSHVSRKDPIPASHSRAHGRHCSLRRLPRRRGAARRKGERDAAIRPRYGRRIGRYTTRSWRHNAPHPYPDRDLSRLAQTGGCLAFRPSTCSAGAGGGYQLVVPAGLPASRDDPFVPGVGSSLTAILASPASGQGQELFVAGTMART